MFRCPTCGRTYTDEGLRFCLNDGIALVDVSNKQSCTLAEAHSEFGISWSSLLLGIAFGKLKIKRIGGRWCLRRSALQAYIEKL